MNFSDISVVVQGGIDPVWTPECLRSVKRFLPGAYIILSSQKGNNVSLVEGLYDHLVLSGDDLFVFHNEAYDAYGRAVPMRMQNLNRQIQSTLLGLREVRTPYAMKLRSDMIVEGAGFLDVWQKYSAPSGDHRCVSERILVGCHTTRIAKSATWFKHYRCPFNISDFMSFGRREDLLNLWDIPFIGEQDAFYFHDDPPLFRKNWGYRVKNYMRLLPEQYVWTHFFGKFEPMALRWFFDNSPQNVAQHERFIAENLVVLSQDLLQISLPQRESRYVNRYLDFTFEDWLVLYKEYVLGQRDAWLLIQCKIRRGAYLLASLPRIWAAIILNFPVFARLKCWLWRRRR